MPDYSEMSQDEFDACLMEVVSMLTPAQLLALPGVYEALAEALNDDVLDLWASARHWHEEREEDSP